MELPDAQKEFMEILHRVKDPSTLEGFLGWVKQNWFADSIGNFSKYYESVTVILIFSSI